MIKNISFDNHESLNATKAWSITYNPFMGYRAEGTAHRAFMAVHKDFDFERPCKVVTTAKGIHLLVKADADQDEDIYMVHMYGGFRGNYQGILGSSNVDVFVEQSSSKHCTPTCSTAFRMNANGFIVFKLSGRYNPYYYIFKKDKEPMIIKSKEEYNAFIMQLEDDYL